MSSTESQNMSYRLIHCKGVSDVLRQYYGMEKLTRNKKVHNLPFQGTNPSSKTKEYLFVCLLADIQSRKLQRKKEENGITGKPAVSQQFGNSRVERS